MSAVANVAINVDSRGAPQKLRRVSDRAKELENAVRGMNRRLRDSKSRFIAAGQGAKTAATSIKGLGAAVKTALGPIGAALTAVGGLAAAFQTLSQQDFAEAKFRSLGGDSKVLVDELKKVSEELNGQASVVELTGAAYDVASAGFNKAADAAKVLKAASLGATGGFSDINTVGNAATSVLNAYGLSADKAGGLVDRFIQTQNDGKIVVAEYAANIGKVASAAAGLGIPLEEVNAVIAQATASGVQADVAFTGLKGALARLASGEAADALKGVGLDIDAASLKTDGLLGTFKKLVTAGLDTGQIFKALGTEAGPALLPVLNNLERFEQLLKNQKNSAGAAAKAQAEAANTIQGSWKRLTTAIQNLFSDQAELGIAIRETIKAAAVTVELLVKAFQAVGSIIRALVGQTQEAGRRISATWKAVGDFFAKISQFMSQQWQFRLGEILKNAAGGNTALQAIFESIGNAWAKTVDFMGQYFGKFVEFAINGMVGILTGPLQTAFRAAGINIGEAVATGIGSFKGGGRAPKSSADSGYSGLTLPAGLDSSSGSGAGSAGGGKGKRDKAADELKRQREAGIELLTQQERQIKSKLVESSLEKELLQVEYDRLDALKQIGNIAPEQRDEATRQANTLAQMQAGEAIGKTLAEQVIKEQELQQARKDALRPLEQQRELLEAKLNGTEKEFRFRQQVDEIMNQAPGLERATVEELLRGNDALEQRVAQMQEMKQLLGAAAQSVKKGLEDALVSTIEAAVTGAKDLGETLKEIASGVLKDIGRMFIRAGINAAFSGLGFADGGRPPVGQISVVGERGPELFVPDTAGTVIPNEQLSSAMSRYRKSSGNASPLDPMLQDIQGTSTGGALGSSVTYNQYGGNTTNGTIIKSASDPNVIPLGGNQMAAESDAATPSSVIDVRYTVERINNVDYVTATEFQRGLQQAAQQGAQRGEQQTLKRLQMSSSTRKRLGL